MFGGKASYEGCPACGHLIPIPGYWKYLTERKPVSCSRCRYQVMGTPGLELEFIALVPLLFFMLVLDPILFDGPRGRIAIYLTSIPVLWQFVTALCGMAGIGFLLSRMVYRHWMQAALRKQ